MDVPAVRQEEGHTGFLIHLPSAVLALIFIARRIQPFLSLVGREVEFCVLTLPGFELTSQRQKVSRLPTEPPGRPVVLNLHRDKKSLCENQGEIGRSFATTGINGMATL